MSQKYLQKKANGNIVLTKSTADEVKLFLQGKGRKQDKKFTHWVKQRKFKLINYHALSLNNILCTPVTEKVNVTHVIVCTNTITLYCVRILHLAKGQHDTTPLGSYKQVAKVESILHQAGSQEQDSAISRPFRKLHTQCTTEGSDQLNHKQVKVHHDRVEID